jgi:hypothetical protein
MKTASIIVLLLVTAFTLLMAWNIEKHAESIMHQIYAALYFLIAAITGSTTLLIANCSTPESHIYGI